MANAVVKVELIANPAVTRMMTEMSLRSNASKWRLAGTVAASEPEKKRDVEPAESLEESIFKVPTETTDDPLEGLKAQYRAKFGKLPDGRWGVEKLKTKLNEAQ